MTEIDDTWDELRAQLKKYVHRRVHVDVAEDLVHDILLRVLQNEKGLVKADNPLAWIYAIARNRITDYYRKQSTISTTDDLVRSDSTSADIDGLSENVDEAFAECLRPLVGRLAPKYEEALLLVDFSDMKQADAAERIGLSLSGMKSRVQRGRRQLKDELLACCAIEKDRFGKVIDYEKKIDSNTGQCC